MAPPRSKYIITNVLFFLPSTCFGLESIEPPDEFGAYMKVLWALCLVLALILILFALFKRRFSLINPRSDKAIKVIEIQPVAPRKSVCLIEVRGREYLVGIANESLTLLADLQDQPTTQQSFEDVLSSEQEAVQ